jgi:hypothetical protein
MTQSVYEKQWTEANGNELVIADGDSPKTFVLDFPHKFELTKIVCKLVGGSNNGFDLELFNLPPDGVFVDDGEGGSESLPPVGDEDLALVLPLQSDTAGLISVFATGVPWPFTNKEGSLTVPKKRIFARITVDTQANDNTYELALGGYNVTA